MVSFDYVIRLFCRLCDEYLKNLNAYSGAIHPSFGMEPKMIYPVHSCQCHCLLMLHCSICENVFKDF